jgi:hypothetical protein
VALLCGLLLLGSAPVLRAADQDDERLKPEEFRSALAAVLSQVSAVRLETSLKKADNEADGTLSPKEAADRVRKYLDGCTGAAPCADQCKSLAETDAEMGSSLDALCKLQKFGAVVVTELEERRKVRGKIAFGMVGDDAGPKERTKISSLIELSTGDYPNEFKALWEAQVTYEDGELKEDVTKARASFERNLQPWLQGFAFVERFTDTYLSIDQRYEAGIGADFELRTPVSRRAKAVCVLSAAPAQGSGPIDDSDCPPKTGNASTSTDEKNGELASDSSAKNTAPKCSDSLTDTGDKHLEPWKHLVDLGLLEFDEHASGPRLKLNAKKLAEVLPGLEHQPELLDKLARSAEGLVKLAEDRRVREGVRNRTSEWEASVSVAVFRETESFTLDTQLFDGAGNPLAGSALKVTGVDSLSRFSVRPAIRWRPIDRAELRVLAYYKRALSSGSPGRPTDYRIDGQASMTFSFEKAPFGAEPTVSVIAEVLYDNDPPNLLDTTVPLPSPGQEYRPAVAEKQHNILRLEFGLKW